MKRIATIVTTAAMTGAALVSTTAAPAQAANATCITKYEYSKIARNMTPTRVRQIVGAPGYTAYDGDAGYYEGAWEEVYGWVESWTGYYDEFGNPVYDMTWEVIDYTWNEYTNWVSVRDVVRTFAKCRSWTGGSRRATVWYDNYTQAGSGMRVYGKATYDMFPSGSRVGGLDKARPAAGERPPKPEAPAPLRAPVQG